MGIVALGGLAYLCRNMARLELIVSMTNVPYLLAWVLMPESPRWLLSKGRREEAKRVIRKMCSWNGRTMDGVDGFVDEFVIEKRQRKGTVLLRTNTVNNLLLALVSISAFFTGTIFDLFRLPATRRNTLLMCSCWLSFSMGYFGLVYNTPAFDWSPFLVFAFPGLISIPMNFVAPWVENCAGRKAVLMLSLTGAGGMLFLTLAFSRGSLGVIICSWIGTMLSCLAFRVGYTYAKELYPTTLRATGLGTASAAARVGSIISPLVVMLVRILNV